MRADIDGQVHAAELLGDVREHGAAPLAASAVLHVGSAIFGRVLASSVIRAYQRPPFW